MGWKDRRRKRRREVQERRIAQQRPVTPAGIVQAVSRTLLEMRSGPLPSPGDLEHYDRVVHGAAERIIAMAERQVAMAESQMTHRHGLEERVIRSDIRLAHIGQASGILLGFSGLGSAVYVIVFMGAELGGAALFLGAVASLVGSVILGRKKRDAELARKREERGEPPQR